jgi:hypothetical protein
MTVALQAVDRSFKLRDAIWQEIDGLEFSGEDKSYFSGTCYFVALEHQLGITTLFREQVFSSALALARPMTEAFVRGAWLHHVASDDEVSKFSLGRQIPSIGKMIKVLESDEIFDSGILAKSHEANWKLLCGLTHTGVEQSFLSFAEGSICRNCSPDQVCDALRYTDAIALMAAMGIAMLADSKKCSSRLLELARSRTVQLTIP